MYEKYAMGRDELQPLTLEGKTVFGDMAATLVDSLDTLWMMGLKPEFDRQAKFPKGYKKQSSAPQPVLAAQHDFEDRMSMSSSAHGL